MRFSLVLTVATGICATAIASTTGSSAHLATANSGLELTSAGAVNANDVCDTMQILAIYMLTFPYAGLMVQGVLR